MRTYTAVPFIPRRDQRGLTLVELMVALVLGLLLLTAMVTLFANTSAARRELDRSAELHETGRYALEFLRDELLHAGFYGPLVGVTGTTDEPCSTDVVKWRDSLALHVRGSNQNDISGLFDCIKGNRKPGTDAVFVQRASTCVTGDAGCAPLAAGVPYLQISGCGEEYSTQPFVAAVATSDPSTSPFTLRTKDCVVTKPAPLRRFLRRIFYVGADDTLNYVDITPAGLTAPVMVTAGVDNLQLEYAIDSNADGAPDSYSSVPAATDWPNVVAVRVWVLSRAMDASPKVEGMTYTMADATEVIPADDRRKRHVFSSFVTFATPQGIRE